MRRFLPILIWLLLAIPITDAQTTFVSLSSDTTDLQTGQYYDVQIIVENVTGLWLADVAIAYDPSLLYVQGTSAGNPVLPGPFMDINSSVVIQNRIRDTEIQYNVSRIAPAEPISGSGVIGTFRIYPLAPGAAQLRFSQGELLGLEFTTNAEGSRDIQGTPSISFTPVLLDLTITGEPVAIPPEFTATPPPTSTPITVETTEEAIDTPTLEPTLINITRAPQTPAPLATIAPPVDPPTSSDASALLPVVLGVVVFSGLGILVLLVLWLRRRGR